MSRKTGKELIRLADQRQLNVILPPRNRILRAGPDTGGDGKCL